MLLPSETSFAKLFVAAAIVHPAVSLFWANVLWAVLPQRNTVWWAIVASVFITLFDLRVVAPAFFPEVAALAFWPQLADHLAWGACVGLAFRWCSNRAQTIASS